MATSYCNPAPKFRTLPSCLTTLIIGTTATISGSLYVYLKNHTTGYLHRFTGTTDGAGLLSLNVKDPDADGNTQFIPTPEHDYELWATTTSATNTEEKVNITINAVVYTSLGFTFERVYEDENSLAAYSTQTLKLA